MLEKTHPKTQPPADRPEAESVDREPRPEPTPADQALPAGKEDEPRGQPTSDRFHTEQAHRKGGKSQ